jgi:hypothetical protein
LYFDHLLRSEYTGLVRLSLVLQVALKEKNRKLKEKDQKLEKKNQLIAEQNRLIEQLKKQQ